jgi:dephospho-CoA kinase
VASSAGRCAGKPIVVGLTGNIASGKSLVGQALVRLGGERGVRVAHIDADRLSRQAMVPGTEVYRQIVDAFGPRVVGPDGALDRARLGEIVFGDPAALACLEAIVHPAVIALAEGRIAASNESVVVVEAIKLIESGMVRRLCDVLWVVTAPRAVRLERLVRERGMDRAVAEQRIAAQPPEGDKVAQADRVIDNGGAIEETVRQVEQAWQDLVER